MNTKTHIQTKKHKYTARIHETGPAHVPTKVLLHKTFTTGANIGTLFRAWYHSERSTRSTVDVTGEGCLATLRG